MRQQQQMQQQNDVPSSPHETTPWLLINWHLPHHRGIKVGNKVDSLRIQVCQEHCASSCAQAALCVPAAHANPASRMSQSESKTRGQGLGLFSC